MQKGLKSYVQTQVTTTSRGDILILLYDGAIKYLQQAKEKIQEKNPAAKGILISKALDILNELDSTLNLDKGGELALNLHNLYFFCNTRLLMANLKMDCKMIDEVIKILSGLRSAYAEINEQPEVQNLIAETPPAMATNNRGQSGFTTSGTANMPTTPGTTLRRQAQYSKNMADAPVSIEKEEAPLLSQETENLSLTKQNEQLAPSSTPIASSAPTSKSIAKQEQEEKTQESSMTPNATASPPPSSGFSGRGLAGSQLYKKFAANQQ